MVALMNHLELPRCPHCRVDTPSLPTLNQCQTTDHNGARKRFWHVYGCSRCGGLVTAWANKEEGAVQQVFPATVELDENIPPRAKEYLRQAIDSLHTPSGSVMLAASAVDAMLKAKDYKDGSLYGRVNKAREDHLITPDMAAWAHDVRLDANDERHSDEDAELPKEADARRSIDFAQALAQLLFVLPARVQRGLKEASGTPS